MRESAAGSCSAVTAKMIRADRKSNSRPRRSIPLGLPLAIDAVLDEQADDGLFIPLLERLDPVIKKPGLLVVGDCKRSVLDIRVYLSARHQFYLSPLPWTG